MNILLQNEGSGWVLDEIVKDYTKYTRHNVVDKDPDIIWCVSMHKVCDMTNYKCKKVASVHHIDKYQMDQYGPMFKCINSSFDYCISPNDNTIEVASKDISIPFKKFPYWVLSNRMDNIVRKSETDEIVIGSFIKDSWGKKPKLSKGPDIFLEILKELKKTYNIKILLSGMCGRRYLRDHFNKEGIKYEYYDVHPDINDLYNKIDWYFVTSRYEGGPQSVLECSYRGIKILSTDVGMAKDVLHDDCICDNVDEFVEKFSQDVNTVDYNRSSVRSKFVPEVIVPKLDDFFDNVLNGGNCE